MNTVRSELKFTALPPGVDKQVTDQMMDTAECLIWKKFDKMKREEKLRVKALKFLSIDISGHIAGFLVKVLGPRPADCPPPEPFTF